MDHLEEDNIGGEVQGGRHVQFLAGGQRHETAVIAAHELFEVDEAEGVNGYEGDDQLDDKKRHKVDELCDKALPHGRNLEVVELDVGGGGGRGGRGGRGI